MSKTRINDLYLLLIQIFIIMRITTTHILVRHTINYDKIVFQIRNFLCSHEPRWASLDEDATVFCNPEWEEGIMETMVLHRRSDEFC